MIKIKEQKKSWKIFKISLSILFLIFLINYYNINNGYYEKKVYEKTVLTNKNLKEFENDIQNNKYIDLKNYNNTNSINTNGTFSKIGYNISENINNIVTKKTKEIYEILKKLFS